MSTADMTPQDDRPRPAPGEGEVTPDGYSYRLPESAKTTLGLDHDPTMVEPPPPEATPDQVRGALRALGKGVHRAAGDSRFPEHWAFTAEELDEITPPLTSIVNRSMILRRFIARSEYIQLGLALFGWSSRNAEMSTTIAEAEAELSGDADTVMPVAPPTPEEPEITASGPFGPLYNGGM